MSYYLDASEKIKKIFEKIKRKDPVQARIIKRKIREILENPYQFKPLKGNMSGIRRVHIGKSYVLTYEILESKKVVRLLDYAHHDNVYD
jgi:YafQ family addiction module toxin component